MLNNESCTVFLEQDLDLHQESHCSNPNINMTFDVSVWHHYLKTLNSMSHTVKQPPHSSQTWQISA